MFVKRKRSEQERYEKLRSLGVTIARKRDEAVSARKESGIEQIMQECEDAYLGIDDSNRHEFSGAKWAKSRSMDGPISSSQTQSDNRSTAYVRLTSRYVDFAASKMSEIALPIDDKAFNFTPTPVPELIEISKQEMPMIPQGMPQPPMMQQGLQQGMPGFQQTMMPQQGLPQGLAQGQPTPDEAKAVLARANEAAKKAETRIYDWMVECRHTSEMRKVIHDSARIGVGVLKGPIPDKRKSQAIKKNGNIIELEIIESIVPVTEWKDPWNIFPDPACGENIQDGDYIFERDYMSPKRLRELRTRRGWNAAQIDSVLDEGPGKVYQEGHGEEKSKRRRYEVWQYYGMLTREELESANVKVPEECEEAYAIITLVNDSVVRCILNPLDSGKFPYHAFAWSRRAGSWIGVGVGEQVSMPQKMVNASTRAVLENAGLSAGVQAIMDRGLVTPADGSWEITRNKIWFKAADAVLDDVRKAFHIFEIPSTQKTLMPIIQYALRLAEEHSSIPMVTQGNYTETAAPQTFGQAELQNNNALAFLRERGNMLDDAITEPLVLMFYEWLLLDTDVPTEEKGDFKINAHGTSALVEKAIQELTITQALSMSLNPAFGADPEKTYALWLKSKRIDPRDVQLDDEKKQALMQRPPPKAPQVEAAEIRAQVDMEREKMRNQTSIEKMRMDTDRDAAYVAELRERAQSNAMTNIEELRLRRELALLDYANKNQISLANIKADLAKTAMELNVTKELAAGKATADQLPTPPVEPPGRAPSGESYQK